MTFHNGPRTGKRVEPYEPTLPAHPIECACQAMMAFDGGGPVSGVVTEVRLTTIGFEMFGHTFDQEKYGAGFKVPEEGRRKMFNEVCDAVLAGRVRFADLHPDFGKVQFHPNHRCVFVESHRAH